MSKTRKVIIFGIEILCEGNKVESNNYPYGRYNFHTISRGVSYLKHGRINRSGIYLNIYNYSNRKNLYIKPKSYLIDDIIQASKEAESHVWPILGTKMKPMGLKCNYWDHGFRIEVSKVKDYYRVKVFKHQLVENDYIKRRKSTSYKTDYEGIKSIIMEAKLSLL